SLKNADVKKLLKELIFNRRHLRTTIIFLVQTWYSIEKDIRKLFSNIFCFRVAKQELESIFNEVVESKAKYMTEISKMVFDRPYKYLFINVNSQRLFDGFDELIFEEE
ncbi:MAG: ATPase/DNA packaging protein, partial [Sediminibacterium sp.]